MVQATQDAPVNEKCSLAWSEVLLSTECRSSRDQRRWISTIKHSVKARRHPLSEEGNSSGQRQQLCDRQQVQEKLRTTAKHMQFMGYSITEMRHWNSWERKSKLGQKLTITIFYYITINRSSTVWQKNDKFQITSQHILLKTLKILKQTVVFFFFLFFNLMSDMTNIPRSRNQMMEKLDHTAYVPHQIKHNVQNVHVSVYTIQK